MLLPALTLWVSAASAQVKASEAASVSQTIDGTKMTIEYSRPKARGRKDLIGGEVHWGEVWTAGANASTTFETSKDISLNGHPVPKGKYSVWLQPRKKGPWMAMLDTNSKRFHTQRPDTTQVPIRFEVEATKGPFVPTLTWAFEDLRLSGGQLTMRWGTMGVAMDLGVQPTFELRVSEDTAAPYLGWYDLVVDPAGTTRPYRPVRGTLRIEHRDGSLRGSVATTVLYQKKEQSWSYEIILLPNKDGSFSPGFTLKGELASQTLEPFSNSSGPTAGLRESRSDTTTSWRGATCEGREVKHVVCGVRAVTPSVLSGAKEERGGVKGNPTAWPWSARVDPPAPHSAGEDNPLFRSDRASQAAISQARMDRDGPSFARALGRYLRVVTLPDGETVHNAFPDRRFQVPER